MGCLVLLFAVVAVKIVAVWAHWVLMAIWFAGTGGDPRVRAPFGMG